MDNAGGGSGFFENDYVRVGLPVLLGVAAASGPAGARGAGALVTAMSAMNGMSSSRTQKQLREMQIRKEQAPQLVEQQGQTFFRDPMTGDIRPADLAGLGGGPVGVLQRRLNETLMAPTPLPEGQQGPPSPATSGDMLARISALQQTPEGRTLLAMNPTLGKMVSGESEAQRGIQTAVTQQQALMPGKTQERVATESALQPLMVERQRQQGLAAAEVAPRRQEALRQEETRARENVSLLEAANAGLMQDKSTNIRRYYWTQGEQAGQSISPAKMTLPEARKLEAEGKITNIPDENMHKEYVTLQQITPLVAKIRTGLETIYSKGGIFENISPASRLAPDFAKNWWAQHTQTDPELVKATREIQGYVTLINKKLAGGTGTQTEQDIARAMNVFPDLTRVPDTKEVAFGTFNNLIDLVNNQAGVLLLNPQFQHPALKPLPIEQKQPVPAAGTPPPVPAAPAGGTGFDANSVLQKYRK